MIELFIGSLISGLLGVLISTIFYIRRENRMIKLETLKKLAANRHDLNIFSGALNEVFVVFNDSPAVMEAVRKFHQEKVNERNGLTELTELFSQMCKNVSVKFEETDKELFTITFGTKSNQPSS